MIQSIRGKLVTSAANGKLVCDFRTDLAKCTSATLAAPNVVFVAAVLTLPFGGHLAKLKGFRVEQNSTRISGDGESVLSGGRRRDCGLPTML